jgi:predicted PurR-regulated permease PerM
MTESAPVQRTIRENIVFAFAVAVGLLVAWWVREVLVLIYVSALFAVVLTPLIHSVMTLRIGKWSPGRGSAIALLMFGTLSLIVLFLGFGMPPMVHDLHNVGTELPQHASSIATRIRQVPLVGEMGDIRLRDHLQNFATSAASYILDSLPNAAHIAGQIFMGIVLTVYFLLEGETAYAWLLSMVPITRRVRLDAALQRAEMRMGKWLLGQGLLMLILGVLSLIVFAALHLRYYYVLAVLMGLFNIIPVAGAAITVTLAILVAALDSWTKVVGVAIFYFIYVQVENVYLTPRIMRHSVDLAGLTVIIAFLFGVAIAGVLGAIVAVPTAVLVAVLMEEYLVKDNTSPFKKTR